VLGRDRLGVRRVVRLDQAFGVGGDEAVRRAAPPDAELRRFGTGREPRQGLAGREAHVVGLDAELLAEAVDHHLAPVLLRRAEDGQRVLEVAGRRTAVAFVSRPARAGAAVAARGQNQYQDQ
jgi:hypothetical protein